MPSEPIVLFDDLPGERFFSAKWIWAPYSVKANAHLLFRSSFKLDEVPSGAFLFIAVESVARVFINDEEVLQTSSLSYPGQHYCETAELTEYLKEGNNEIAILAWYIGVPSGASCPKDPALLAEIVARNGKILSSTSASWKVRCLNAWQGQYRRSKWLNLDLIEILDYRQLPEGFPFSNISTEFVSPEESNYLGARFVHVEPRCFAKPEGNAYQDFKIIAEGIVDDKANSHEIPSLAIQEEKIEPAKSGIRDWDHFELEKLPTGKAWSLVIDLGTYEKGFPEFIAAGDPGAEIDITWYETFGEKADQDILTKVHNTDRFILSGKEDEIRSEEWKCGRYLQLTFRKIRSVLHIRNFKWKRLHYPLHKKVLITSSSRQLESIIDISLRAAAICMHDNIMDCPWRERRQWIGDVQRIALINYYGFGEFDLPRAVLKQHARLQQTSGRMWVCLPVNEEFPSQSMEWLRAVLEYQEYSGDSTLIHELGHNIRLLHLWFMGCRDERGLFFLDARPAINWMDNSYGSNLSNVDGLRKYQFETPYLALNLRYLLFLDDVSTSLLQMDQPEAAASASAERTRLAGIIKEHFHDPEHGLLRDCGNADIPATFSEMGHALAVLCDLPGGDQSDLWDRFLEYSRGNPVIPATPFGKHQTYEAMGKLGRPDAIIKDIINQWGPMVDAGSDTTWEGFRGDESRCHGWAGIPLVAILRHVLKQEPSETGERTIKNMGGLDWIRAVR